MSDGVQIGTNNSGAITISGSVSLVGENSRGIHIMGNNSGPLTFSGNFSSISDDSEAIRIIGTNTAPIIQSGIIKTNNNNSDGIDIKGANSGDITLSGNITPGSLDADGLDIDSANSATITNFGGIKIQGQTGDGIEVNDNLIAGIITNSSTGWITASSQNAGGIRVNATNSGAITNAGKITILGGATTSGIYAVTNDGTGTIGNSGMILAAGTGITHGIFIDTTNDGAITNSGTVTQSLFRPDSYAVRTDGGAGSLTNTGTLKGNVSLAGTNSYIQGTGGVLEFRINPFMTESLLAGTATFDAGSIQIKADEVLTTQALSLKIVNTVTSLTDNVVPMTPVNGAALFSLTVDRTVDASKDWVITGITAASFASAATNPAQAAVASFFDANNVAVSTGGGDLNLLMMEIFNQQTIDGVQDGLRQASGEGHAANFSALLGETSLYNQTLFHRMGSQRTTRVNGADLPLLSHAGGDPKMMATAIHQSQAAHRCEHCWNAFVEGFGNYTDFDPDCGHLGHEAKTGGMTVGLDQYLDHHSLIGLSLGYAYTHMDWNQEGSESDINGLTLAAYYSYSKDCFFWDNILGYGYRNIDTCRQVSVGGFTGDFDSDHSAHVISLSSAVGLILPTKSMNFIPTLGFQYTYMHQEDFEENGGSASLHVCDANDHSFKGLLGLKVNWPWVVDGGLKVIPELFAYYQYEFADQQGEFTGQFSGVSGTSFGIKGGEIGRSSALLGGSLVTVLNDCTNLYTQYTANFNTNMISHTLALGLSHRF